MAIDRDLRLYQIRPNLTQMQTKRLLCRNYRFDCFDKHFLNVRAIRKNLMAEILKENTLEL